VHAGGMTRRFAAGAALALLLAAVGGSLAPTAQATPTHRPPVLVDGMHGNCHVAGDEDPMA
jgi:hypothetical protein